MKTIVKNLCAIVALSLALASCTKLNSGDSFNATVDGIEYNFEVIVSKVAFVRLRPVSGPAIVTGNVTLPTTSKYDGVTYTVTQIASNAFKGYSGITTVVLPSTLSQIEEGAFAGCTSLESINTPQPLSVIGDYAFDGCYSLKAFSLDASISELGVGAFRNCSSLTGLEFTPTFTDIPARLCEGCSGLTAIELPSTILSVGESAFEGCTGVVSVSMDRSVQTLGAKAFSGCSFIQDIRCLTATPPAAAETTFYLVDPLIRVTVPMASVSSYQNAPGWSRFANIIGTY